MMMDVFSSFDPMINFLFMFSSLFIWIFMLSFMIIMNSFFWMNINNIYWINMILMDFINKQSLRTKVVSFKGFSSFYMSLFIMLIYINLMGLLPYSFSISSQFLFTLSLGLPLWFFMILSSINNNYNEFMGGLLPSGAPQWLNFFLVIVESISIMVRPITLSIRLMANMSAGHIVLTLIGGYMANLFFNINMSFIMLFFLNMGYLMFEMGICLVQAYIFCLLLSLYSEEHSY